MALLDNPLNASAYQNGNGELPAFEPEMSVREKALRDCFVAEYLVDYDAVCACLRIGFNNQFAKEFAIKLMAEPYVQKRINEVRFQDIPEKDLEAYNKKRIASKLMQEAHYMGPGSSHAARVAALSKLAALNNMEPAKKVDATVNHRGGVMAVPGIAKLDDWEKAASASQDTLVAHASD